MLGESSTIEPVVLEALAAATATTRFPGLKLAACRDATVNENSPANIATPAKNREGIMEDKKDEKIRPGAECTPSALRLITGDTTQITCSTFPKILGLFCDNMMALILR